VKEFDLDGIPAFESVKDKSQIHGHSMPLVALGTLILFFGFLGFNGGSVLTLDGFENGVTMSLAVVNTVLAASGGGIAAVTVTWITSRKYWSLMQVRLSPCARTWSYVGRFWQLDSVAMACMPACLCICRCIAHSTLPLYGVHVPMHTCAQAHPVVVWEWSSCPHAHVCSGTSCCGMGY
jgi:hypothetical protein